VEVDLSLNDQNIDLIQSDTTVGHPAWSAVFSMALGVTGLIAAKFYQ
jgi:hypothetical protein